MEEESIPRVLVIESSTADLYILDYYLYPNFEVFSAETGEEALKLLQRMVFDCVIISAKLPDCRAKDLVSTIQAHFGPVPVVLLSGADDAFAHPAVPVNGVSSCVNKDLITNELLVKTLWDVMEHTPVLSSMLTSLD